MTTDLKDVPDERVNELIDELLPFLSVSSNYTGCLNACAAVVRTLSHAQQIALVRHLFRLLDIQEEAKHGDVEITCVCLIGDTTTRQFAEALYLTLKK